MTETSCNSEEIFHGISEKRKKESHRQLHCDFKVQKIDPKKKCKHQELRKDDHTCHWRWCEHHVIIKCFSALC